MCRVKVLFWRNPAVPLRFSRVSASFRYMAMCRVFQKRTQCVPQQCACARFVLSVFAFCRRVRFDVFRVVCALFVVFASVFQKNAFKPTSSWSVVIFRHCARVDVLRAVCTLFVVCASVFQKCARTDLSGECRCFPLPCLCLLSRQATCARFFCC